MKKVAKGYKTVVFNLVMVVVAVATVLNPEAQLPGAEDVEGTIDAVDAAVVSVWGAGNMILRALTNSPIFSKDSAKLKENPADVA